MKPIVATIVILSVGVASTFSPRRYLFIFFLLLGLAYVPFDAGFALTPLSCAIWEGWKAALWSVTNYKHILLFAVFFLISGANLHGAWRILKAATLTLLFGVLLELEEAAFGLGHCRSRDLLPDSLGVLAGLVFCSLSIRSTRIK